MAPSDDLDDDVDWPCELCQDLLFEPVTLPCCGTSFCQSCIRQWVITKLDEGASVRCPAAACSKVISWRLPAVSSTLCRTLEALVPMQVERRRQEQEAEPAILGGFTAWQEVVAARDLKSGSTLLAAFGTKGVVLCNHTCDGCAESNKVKVKFDLVLIGNGTVNVSPHEIVPQLSESFGFKIADVVAASRNLMVGDEVVAPFGTQGTVIGAALGVPDRLSVLFEGKSHPFNVTVPEITFYMLVGGYRLAQRVQASKDLCTNGDTLIVRCSTPGTVMAQYSDTRLIVQFDDRADGSSLGVNVTVSEIKAL